MADIDPRQQLTNVLAEGFTTWQGATRTERKRGEYQFLIDAIFANPVEVVLALGGRFCKTHGEWLFDKGPLSEEGE